MTIEEAKQIWKEIPLNRCEDFTNKQFGKLTCLYRTENSSSKNTMWVCQCECGTIRPFKIANVKSGHTVSCGCKTSLNLIGQRFGKLTVIKKAQSRNGKTYWLCQCDCGNQKEIQGVHLTMGSTKSCGCLNSGEVRDNITRFTNCIVCGAKLTKGESKYCSTACQNKYQREQSIKEIFLGKVSGLKKATTSSPKIKDSLRTYLLEQAQYKCELCGCDWINPYSQKTILEIHHIDGDRMNNSKDNLQVLCPNCHAMTPNFKGLNIKRDK